MQSGVRGCTFSFTWISYEISLLNKHKHISLTHNEWEWQMSDVGCVRGFLLVSLRNRKAGSQFYECREWTHGDCYAMQTTLNEQSWKDRKTYNASTNIIDYIIRSPFNRQSTEMKYSPFLIEQERLVLFCVVKQGIRQEGGSEEDMNTGEK